MQYNILITTFIFYAHKVLNNKGRINYSLTNFKCSKNYFLLKRKFLSIRQLKTI